MSEFNMHDKNLNEAHRPLIHLLQCVRFRQARFPECFPGIYDQLHVQITRIFVVSFYCELARDYIANVQRLAWSFQVQHLPHSLPHRLPQRRSRAPVGGG